MTNGLTGRTGVRRAVRTATLALAVVSLCGTVQAGWDVDFGVRVSSGDDADLFFAMSTRYFERDRDTVQVVHRRLHHPDDVAVALFLARHSGRSLDAILDLRIGGTSWWDISVRYGVPAKVWFVEVDRDPGPPYGKAYGHWKKHRRDRTAMRLSDADMRNLVAVRVLHDYYDVPVSVAMEWRSSGDDVRHLMAREYRRRHGAVQARASQSTRPAEKAPGNSKRGPGKGKGKGHGKKH